MTLYRFGNYKRPMTPEELAEPELWNNIASYMSDEPRETAHALAPCTEWEFLERYLQLDPGFTRLLADEFNIEVEGVDADTTAES